MYFISFDDERIYYSQPILLLRFLFTMKVSALIASGKFFSVASANTFFYRFVNEQLFPSWKKFKNELKVDLKPFGKANVS